MSTPPRVKVNAQRDFRLALRRAYKGSARNARNAARPSTPQYRVSAQLQIAKKTLAATACWR
jgi:hypothetical protein